MSKFKVVCVCLGNICRSPTAEAVLRAKYPEWEIDSAGTSGWHIGDPPYEPMQLAAKAKGYDLSPLRARQFTAGDFQKFDLILAMDTQNQRDIENLRPYGSTTPVQLFDDQDVPDPYYTRDFDGALSIIEKAATALSGIDALPHR